MTIFDILGNLESVGILHLLSNSCDEYYKNNQQQKSNDWDIQLNI
jgi:hypothetical protein